MSCHLYGSSCGGRELDGLVALAVEDHCKNHRRHYTGDDPGSHVAKKLKHGPFPPIEQSRSLNWDLSQSSDTLVEQQYMTHQTELLDSYAALFSRPGLFVLPN
jgi:hypothetical protein